MTKIFNEYEFFDYVEENSSYYLQPDFCVIDVDLQHHRLFNDLYGFQNGESLIDNIEAKLVEFCDENDSLLARASDEDFILLTKYDEEKIKQLHSDLEKEVEKLSSIEGFSPAFGIAICDVNSDIRGYYNRAALTSEEIKNDLLSRIRIYDSSLHEKKAQEYIIVTDFNKALTNDEIVFFVQPQVRLPEKRIVGGEALARWNRNGEFLSPTLFVPVLEKYNLITKMDTYLWDKVGAWLADLIKRGIEPVPISVNVSRVDIAAINVVEFFKDLIKKYNLDKKYIKIEITESAYAENANIVGEAVKRLREEGFMVLMDDFGSAYSSLNMLRSMAVDVIKLDAEFLDLDNSNEQKGVSIIESVVNLTKNLAMPIIVEGVENDYQREYLNGLGCLYMQGYYFYRPMPVEDFEKLISDKDNVDNIGLKYNPNQPLHIREFMDENIYSDVMLNNIIGPVAFYNWSGENVDIVRYNKQFFTLVGIDSVDFEERKISIQNVLFPSDVEKLYKLLQEAVDHKITGSKGVIRAYRPNGDLVALSLQLYYFDENQDGKLFYVSAHNVTEMQFDSDEFPGAYYRVSNDENMEFYNISPNFERMTGYSKTEIELLFNNRLTDMIHPADRQRVINQCKEFEKNKVEISPYRIKHKTKGYIYIAEQNQISDLYGIPCFQTVALDITETMKLRNQMNILSNFMSDTIMLVYENKDGYEYKVIVHGKTMSNKLGIKAEELENSLNSGEFCKLIDGYDPSIPHSEYTKRFITEVSKGLKTLDINGVNGKVEVIVKADKVGNLDNISYIDRVSYIVLMHAVEIRNPYSNK